MSPLENPQSELDLINAKLARIREIKEERSGKKDTQNKDSEEPKKKLDIQKIIDDTMSNKTQQDSAPTQNSTTEDTTKESFFKRNKFGATISSAILSAGALVTSLHSYEKNTEKRELEKDLAKIENIGKKLGLDTNKLDELGSKINKLKNLLGENFTNHNYRIINQFKEHLRNSKNKIAHFSYFSIKKESPEFIVEDEYAMEYPSINFGELEESGKMEFISLNGNRVEGNSKTIIDYFSNNIFPKGSLHGEVKCVKQVPSYSPNEGGKNLGLGKDWITIADCESSPDKENTIRLFNYTKDMNMVEILKNLSHEVGHANSWETDNELSLEERVDLLLDVVNRVQSKDRFYSAYVEAIHNKDTRQKLYDKTTEYWAEIYSAYLTNPESLNYKDFNLVDKIVKKSDPNFKPKTKKGVLEAIKELENDH
jgi:hypothetical protein